MHVYTEQNQSPTVLVTVKSDCVRVRVLVTVKSDCVKMRVLVTEKSEYVRVSVFVMEKCDCVRGCKWIMKLTESSPVGTVCMGMGCQGKSDTNFYTNTNNTHTYIHTYT